MSKKNEKIIRKWGRPYIKPKGEHGSPQELLKLFKCSWTILILKSIKLIYLSWITHPGIKLVDLTGAA